MKNPVTILAACVLAVGLGVWTLQQDHVKNRGGHSSDRLYGVMHVYDGDTVKLESGEHVRLIGIDAPEAHDNDKLTRDVNQRHIDRATQLAMGERSAKYAASLMRSNRVRLEFDVEERDRYGRLLAYVYLPDGTFVNEKIIREGYAYPLTVPPNVRHAREFKQWFNEAREQKRGLWQ